MVETDLLAHQFESHPAAAIAAQVLRNHAMIHQIRMALVSAVRRIPGKTLMKRRFNHFGAVLALTVIASAAAQAQTGNYPNKLFAMQTGATMTPVHFKGGGPVIIPIMASSSEELSTLLAAEVLKYPRLVKARKMQIE